MRRAVLLILIGVTLITTVGSAAVAQSTETTAIEPVAQALRRDPVYVDPNASRTLTEDEATGLRTAIRNGNQPIFIAVVDAGLLTAVGGSLDALVRAIVRATGLAGTYAVVAGNSFRAVSSTVAQAAALATAAFQAHRDEGPAAVLEDFVGRVEEVAPSSGAAGAPVPAPAPPTSAPAADDGGGFGALPWVLVIGGAVAAFALWLSRRRRTERAEQARQRAADRQMVQAELSVLGDDVVGLEDLVALHPEARVDYEAGVSRYRAASAALESAGDQVDLVRVERVVQEGQYAMARARARAEGREPPPPPESLQQRGRHGEPPVTLDEQAEPVYAGGRYPFYGGGWFGGGSGLFTGLLLGSVLGGGWGPNTVYVDDRDDGGDDGGDGGADGGDGGDWGGGDWGGGDLGGDWGGGDIGGGDWG